MCMGITCDVTGEPARLEADARNRRLGPLVQHPPPPPRPGRHHTTTSRKPTHNNTKGSGLNKPPQNPGLDKQREGHCTRYMARHPLRCATPDQKGCHAYGSGALPPTTSTTADSSSRHTQAAASDAATQPRNTCPAPNKRRYTRSVALHPIRRGALPTDRVRTQSQEQTRNLRDDRRHAANTPAASSSCCKPPPPNSRPLHRGRILTVPMESAPAGQVAVAGAVVRPESDDGNHPSKSRTQFNAVIFRDRPQTLQFQRPHFNV